MENKILVRKRSLAIVAASGLMLSLLVQPAASAGSNIGEVRVSCATMPRTDLSTADVSAMGYGLLKIGARGKVMNYTPSEALGEFDTLLTSEYGLRKPLATLTNPRQRKQMAETSQLLLSGYVVAAQMMHGVMRGERQIPDEILRISGNMIFTANEPDGADPVLGEIYNKVQLADQAIAKIGADRLPYARWIIRGYAYNDPVAVDAGIAGYCMSKPSQSETGILQRAAKAVRFDTSTIKTHP